MNGYPGVKKGPFNVRNVKALHGLGNLKRRVDFLTKTAQNFIL